MKKILILALVICTTLICLKPTLAQSLSFVEEQNNETNVSGVTHQKVSGKVINDNNTTSNQQINVFTKSDDIEVVYWSKFNNGSKVNASTLEIAKDFENLNNQYEVIAGVNGDYYNVNSPFNTISANVAYGNRVITSSNHQKYTAIEFNLNGKYINRLKQTHVSEQLSLTLTNKDNILLSHNVVSSLNKVRLNDNETTYLNNDRHLYDREATYYDLVNVNQYMNGLDVFIEGTIDKQVTSVTKNRQLVTKDETLINKINSGDQIIIQKEVKKSNYNNMLVGVDGEIIKDGVVNSFDEMTGQNDANNKSRHPRTGLGFDNNGNMILITVDGRQGEISAGVNLREFAIIMKKYGIINGFNLDGGGSTQAVFKKDDELQFVNTHSDNTLRKVGSALLFVKKKNPTKYINYSLNNLNLELELPNDETLTSIDVYINGIKTNYLNQKEKLKIALPILNKVTMSIVGNYQVGNNFYREVVTNEIFEIELPEEEFKPIELKITDLVEKEKLIITIEYEDPKKQIDSIRVFLTNPTIDLPALVQNSTSRRVIFELNEKIKSQEVKIVIKYKGGIVLEEIYFLKTNSNNLVAIVAGTATIIIGISLFLIVLTKKKRNR